MKKIYKRDLSREIVLFWLKFFHLKINEKIENLLVQIFKFGIVGVVATVIDFLFLYIFRDLCKLDLLLANTIAFCISLVYNYYASMTFVFDVNKDKSQVANLIIFCFCSIIGLILNDLILYLITNKLGVHYMISKVIATLFVMIFNFVTRKKFLE